MKKTKKATAGERIEMRALVKRWPGLFHGLDHFRTAPEFVVYRESARAIDRECKRKEWTERQRCIRILWRWYKSARSACTPLGQDVCEHLEAIIKEVGNPK